TGFRSSFLSIISSFFTFVCFLIPYRNEKYTGKPPLIGNCLKSLPYRSNSSIIKETSKNLGKLAKMPLTEVSYAFRSYRPFYRRNAGTGCCALERKRVLC